MESQIEKVSGTIQYWLEVHRIGSLLFQNLENGDGALQSLITSIIETPLLSDIECLSDDWMNGDVTHPFTSWILQALLKASVFNSSASLREFYTQAQSKLLSFVHENNAPGFHVLINHYIQAVDEVFRIKSFNINFKFLLLDDYPLLKYDRKLITSTFEIRNKYDQINCATILIEVITNLRHLIINDSLNPSLALQNLVITIFISNIQDLKYLVLPLLALMMRHTELDLNDNVMKHLYQTIMLMIDDPVIVANQSYQDDIMIIWNFLKNHTCLPSVCSENFIRRMAKIKDLYANKNFIYNEIIFLVSQSKISALTDISLENDQLCIMFGLITNEIKTHIRNNKDFQKRTQISNIFAEVLIFNVNDISDSWNKVYNFYIQKFHMSNGKVPRDHLNFCKNFMELCNKTLWKLDDDLQLSRYHTILVFFGNDISKLFEILLADIKISSSSTEETFMTGIKILSDLMNLPEISHLAVGNFKKVSDFLVASLMSEKFHLPGFDLHSINCSPIPSLFLKSLQCIPHCISLDCCMSIFSNCAIRKNNTLLNLQSIRSVPILYMTKKIPPSRLILEILFPALAGNTELQIAIIGALTDLVCAMSGSGFVIRNPEGELVIQCAECSSLSPIEDVKGEVLSAESHVIKLITEISLSSAQIKYCLIKNLSRLTMHMNGIKDKCMLSKLLIFLQDENEDVRQAFARIITSVIFGRKWVMDYNLSRQNSTKFFDFESYINKKLNSEIMSSLELVFKKLEELIHLSLKSKGHRFFQQSLLETLTNIACFPLKRVLSKSMRLLLLFINVTNAPLSTIFSEIAAAHRTTQLVLFYSYRPEITQFLGNLTAVKRLLHNQSLRTTLGEITTLFKGLSDSRFAIKSENYIVPILFKWTLKFNEMQNLLYEWSDYVEQPLPVVITNTFQYIYTYILLNETHDAFDKCMMTIERLTDLKISDLTLHSQKSIINELLFNYHCSPDRVLLALKNIIGGSSPDRKKESIVDGLGARFVGYLLFIVSKFVKDINSDCDKIHAIQSLTAVIELMGKNHVTPVARKVLATLQTTINFNFDDYCTLHYKSLKTFIYTVDIEQLGPLLATIITLLIPFLEYEEVDVAGIFDYLIIQNEKAVSKYLPSLIFLPNHPKLMNVNKVMNKHIDFKNEILKDRLVRETSLALHETVRVRMEGLKALRRTIENSSSDIQNLINGSDEPDPCIRTLLESLIICCSDPDPNISLLAAICLGQLGAIDPGLLPRKPKPKNELPLSVHDPEFAFLSLTEITRGFQNARKSVDMDAFAVAIQELLKMYQISPAGENGIWSRFPRQIQGLIMPMLNSRYKVQAPKRSSFPDIIFGSKEASSHINWGSLWASKLIGFCKDDRAVILFKVCEPSLKCDVKVLLFFLRYILLHAVIRDPSVHELIIKEIESVITWSRNAVESDGIRTKSRPVRLIDYCGYPSMKSTITISDAQTCAVTVFLLLDFLHSWLRTYRAVYFSSNGDQVYKKDFSLVKAFLEKINYLQISIANYEIREYSRAIMYLEDVIGQDKEKLCEHLPLLSKAYALYGDLDSVAGASSFQKTAPKMEDLLLSHQVSGQLEEVRIIFERFGKDRLMTPAHIQEMTRCYLNLGEPYTAINCIQSFTSQQPDLMSILSECMAESLIKLGDFTQLTKFLEDEQTASHKEWFVQIGRIFLGLHRSDNDYVSNVLLNVRTDVANAFRQTGLQFGDYQQGYSYLIKLQILCEIERISEIIKISQQENLFPLSTLKQLIVEWDMRCGIVQTNANSLEPLLSIRRLLLTILKEKLPNESNTFLNNEIGKLWVKSAEIARKAGCFHQSYNYILNAEEYNIPLTFIEKAQLFWDKGDQDLCLFTLNRGIKEFFPNAAEMKNWPAGERLEERKICAEAELLYAIYSEDTSNCDHNTNITNYQNAFDVCRQLEKSQAFLAQCLDRVVGHLDGNEQDQNKACELKILMVHHFGKSLIHGCEYIYQTVPRMLSIWLDMGEKQDTPEKVNAMLKINKLIEHFLEVLPPFIFMTALPQLLSRLGHPNGKVFAILKKILATLVKAFPQQCLWAMQIVAKSSVEERVKRYDDFIQHPILRSASLYGLIRDFTSLCDELNKLTNCRLPQNAAFRGLKVSSVVKDLKRLLTSDKFSAIIIPITQFCSISLPRNIKSSTHEPFPKDVVYITGVEEEITVLSSLQRPRKISFRGSDGKLYDILCKPTDDLRRDGRLMEFNNIVNMYLHRDPESRARSLHIRTYVVIPLGESGGLLEWIPNLVGLRHTLIRLYKQFGKYTKQSELKLYECQVRDPLEKKRSIFVDKLLKLHPPLFPEWFRLTFPDPSGWYLARQSYTRTTAVMSMVGYILGLGDRHGENVLFDCESGDTVHVDFNCLFNKGEKFDWKERVPFRLTHNMVAAMGPLGVEGTYRKSCEISLRVLRSQTKTLMSVLTPFAYDPFGSWGKNKEIVQNERDQKRGEAFKELSDIEKRLNGSLRVKQKNSTFYLSVEGLARSLIMEATDIDNLCQMYCGWGAYL